MTMLLSAEYVSDRVVIGTSKVRAWSALVAMVDRAEGQHGEYMHDDMEGPWHIAERTFDRAFIAWPIATGFDPKKTLVAYYGERRG